jgi:hypothetical protein
MGKNQYRVKAKKCQYARKDTQPGNVIVFPAVNNFNQFTNQLIS